MTTLEKVIIKRQQAKLRADLADRIYAISEPIHEQNGARRIDEEAHSMALPANEEPISTEEEI